MARRTRTRSKAGEAGADTAQAIRDSAQKIWLAGLGAFERARTEGPRMFETLVEQGRQMGARAVGAADDVLRNVREAGYGGGRWDKLEQVFEERVSRSLGRLGVVTSRELAELSKQVEELRRAVTGMSKGSGGKASRAKASGGAGARKAKGRKAGAKATRAARAPRA